MARLGVVDRLPKDVREQIGALRQAGRTIDEILDHLEEAHGYKLVRSTLGLHIKKLDELGARLRESQAAADALMRPLADAGEDRLMRALVASMQSLMMDVLASKAGEDVVFDAEEFMFFARGLKDLGAARKTDADLVLKIEEQAAKKASKLAAERAEKAIARQGVTLSAEALQAIRQDIYGIVG